MSIGEYINKEPRELGVYDCLAWVDIFGHEIDGQAGIVLGALAREVRRLNRDIEKLKSGGGNKTFDELLGVADEG